VQWELLWQEPEAESSPGSKEEAGDLEKQCQFLSAETATDEERDQEEYYYGVKLATGPDTREKHRELINRVLETDDDDGRAYLIATAHDLGFPMPGDEVESEEVVAEPSEEAVGGYVEDGHPFEPLTEQGRQVQRSMMGSLERAIQRQREPGASASSSDGGVPDAPGIQWFLGLSFLRGSESRRAFLQSTRLEHGREGLLVDPGAFDNLVGARWVERMEKIAQEQGVEATRETLPNVIGVEGVGKEAQRAKEMTSMPGAFKTLEGTVRPARYQAPIIPDSDIPALRGHESISQSGHLGHGQSKAALVRTWQNTIHTAAGDSDAAAGSLCIRTLVVALYRV